MNALHSSSGSASVLFLVSFAIMGCGDPQATSGGTGGGSSGSSTGTGSGGGSSTAAVLVSNSLGDDIVRFDQETGAFLDTFVAKGSGGLKAPDTITFGPDGALYVSSGDDAASSAVLRYDGKTGAFVDAFTKGGGLVRPYGLVFGPDQKLYVSSFLTDQILRYDGKTGAFLDVFAKGDGKAGGLNGPNGLAFGPDGNLYVATEGSVAVNGMPTFPNLPSQVLRYDRATGKGGVFADQPPVSTAGLGYVSLLGVVFGPDCKSGVCDLFVSDYANDLRRYDVKTGMLKATLDTNYSGVVPSTDNLGSLAFGAGGRLFTVGFDSTMGSANLGSVLRFNGMTGAPLPATGQKGALLVSADNRLLRPIGVTTSP